MASRTELAGLGVGGWQLEVWQGWCRAAAPEGTQKPWVLAESRKGLGLSRGRLDLGHGGRGQPAQPLCGPPPRGFRKELEAR